MIKLKDILMEQMLDEMAFIKPDESGLPYKIWPGCHTIKLKHFKPYVKIYNRNTDEYYAHLSIGDPNIILAGSLEKLSSKDIRKIQEFITINKDELLYHYYHGADTGYNMKKELIDRLKKV